MATPSAAELLRPGLLRGTRVVVAGASAPPSGQEGAKTFAAAVEAACGSLEGRVSSFPSSKPGGSQLDDTEMDAAADLLADELGGIELLFIDACSLFRAAPPDDARGALVGCLDVTWGITRAVAQRAFIARGEAGRIVFAAPPAPAGADTDGGLHVDGARAGLENLARTLSIEWARYAITTVTIAPGAATSPEEVGMLSAYLASPAGAYFSGCLLDLRGTGL